MRPGSLSGIAVLTFVAAVAASAAGGCASKGSASDPCGLVRAVHDPFDGPVRAFVVYLDRGGYTAVSVKAAKDTYTMGVLLVQQGNSINIASPGEKGSFMVGGELMTLELQKEARPVANVAGNTVFSQWMLEFPLTREQLEKLGVGPLTAMKMTVGSQQFQLQPDASATARIQNSARCLVM